MRSVLSNGFQAVICSAFHGIVSFRLLGLHIDSKEVLYLSRFLTLRPLHNKPFRCARALREFTGLTFFSWPPGVPSTLHIAQDSIVDPQPGISCSVLWTARGSCGQGSPFFLQSVWNCFCWRNNYISNGSSFQKRVDLNEHGKCFHEFPWGRWPGTVHSLCLPVHQIKLVQNRKW